MPDGRIMPRSVPDGRGKNRKKRKLTAKIRHKFPLFLLRRKSCIKISSSDKLFDILWKF